MNPEEYVIRLNNISKKKYELLKDIFSLTRSQTAVIDEDSIADLQELIEKKKAKIESINKLDEEFGVYFQRLKQTLKVKSLDDLQDKKISGASELQNTISSIMKLLDEIRAIDDQNSRMAHQVMDNLGSEVKKVSNAKILGSAYKPTTGCPPSYFFDKKK